MIADYNYSFIQNFPDNIFPIDTESRPSIDNEIELSMPNNLHRLTSSLDSIFSKNNVSHSITQNNEGSSMYPFSKQINH